MAEETKEKIVRENPKAPLLNPEVAKETKPVSEIPPKISIPKPVSAPAKPVVAPSPKPVSDQPKPPIKHPIENTVHDKNLIDSLLYMKQNSLMPENKANPKFDSVTEAEEYSIEEVISAVKDEINSIKEDISELQKKGGYELHLEGIKLLEIPLKMKVWQSNKLRKDLEAIYSVILPIKKKVLTFKSEFEAKIAKKEQQEKIKEAEEAKQKPEDPNKIKPIPKFVRPPKD